MLHHEKNLALQRERSLEEKIRKLESKKTRPMSIEAAASVTFRAPRIATVTSTSHPQIVANHAAARALQAFDTVVSDGSTTTTDDEGDQMTTKELTECATHVRQLLQRINNLQRGLAAGQIVKHHRRRRMHKSYMRVHRKLEATFVGSGTQAPITSTSTSTAGTGHTKTSGSIRIDQQTPVANRLADSKEIPPKAAKDKLEASIESLKDRRGSVQTRRAGHASRRPQQGSEIATNSSASSTLSPSRRPTRPVSALYCSYSSPAHEHGPHLSRSAYGNVHHGLPQHYPMYQPPSPASGSIPPSHYRAQQMQPMRDQQRAPLQAIGILPSSRSHNAYAPVVQMERSDRAMPSARYHSSSQLPVLVPRRPQPSLFYRQGQSYTDESESVSDSEDEQDYVQQVIERRQRDQHHTNIALVPPVPEPRRPQTIVVPNERSTRPRVSRRVSVSRPPLVPRIESETAYDAPRAWVTVEGSRSSRHESSVAYDKSPEGSQRRVSRQAYNVETSIRRPRRVRDRAAESRSFERDGHSDDKKSKPIEGLFERRRRQPVDVRPRYQDEADVSLGREAKQSITDQSYEVARRRLSLASRASSEPESSRDSDGARENSEIRLRVGLEAPVTLSLNGDMEGRTLQIVFPENGMNELVIAANDCSASTYRSERGSGTLERRAITSACQSRRDAEELTERESHSSRRRRSTPDEPDEPRRLHRTRRRERREAEYRDVAATKLISPSDEHVGDTERPSPQESSIGDSLKVLDSTMYMRNSSTYNGARAAATARRAISSKETSADMRTPSPSAGSAGIESEADVSASMNDERQGHTIPGESILGTGTNDWLHLLAEEDPALEHVSIRKRKDIDDSDGSYHSFLRPTKEDSGSSILDSDDHSAYKNKKVRSIDAEDDQSARELQTGFSFVESLLGKDWVTAVEPVTGDHSDDEGEDIVDVLLEQWTVPVGT